MIEGALRRKGGALALLLLVVGACKGEIRDHQGTIEGARQPAEAIAARDAGTTAASRALATTSGQPRALAEKRVLFGDLHVHTTNSIDAFFMSLPVVAGEGAHPAADACDFARYCSQLDFYALTDHAESLIPEIWEQEKESVRQCNAVSALGGGEPDLVVFPGFEWTQVGRTVDDHYGHRCVFFKQDDEAKLPARAIDAVPEKGPGLFAGLELVRLLRIFDPRGFFQYNDFLALLQRSGARERCPKGVDVHQLPADCQESAQTPAELHEKLDQWGFEAMSIAHGTSWGLYTPPTVTMDKQLTPAQYDPDLAPVIEIFSGHGNSEEYRWWREHAVDENGKKVCPAPTPDYLPCCWQAGEIQRQRCGDVPAEECDALVETAKQLAMDAGVLHHQLFPDSRAEDWLDCGQCRDCFKPALGLRPRESVQYSMAISNFDAKADDGRPLRFRYGFIGSSDNHSARPGTGYKQFARKGFTEGVGARSEFWDEQMRKRRLASVPDVNRAQPASLERAGFLGADVERVSSFLYPGGLVAVHAAGRDRDAIWDAIERREVYSTSGPRILLWFDVLNGPSGPAPMGSEIALAGAPRFEVRAVGAAVEKEGCPETSVRGLPADRLARLCRDECHNPGDERTAIAAIEIVRIRPQAFPGEPVDRLIEDPWLRFECPPDPAGCSVQFEDLQYPGLGRDTLYYARALQVPTPAINGANLRTQLDAQGRATSTQPCFADYRVDAKDECLAPVQERAWSSPIFVNVPR